MTLTQLTAFLTVARLGSVKAAAAALGVSEPAVSGAVAVLRKELGDPLFIRAGGGVALTSGGRRLAASAAEILGLAEDARRRIGSTRDSAPQIQVAATPAVTEYVVPWLLEAFRRRLPDVESQTLAVAGTAFAELLHDRRADLVIGPQVATVSGPTIESAPFLRYQPVVVCGPQHPLARHARVGDGELAVQQWLLGPGGLGDGTAETAYLRRLGLADGQVSTFPSAEGALHAAGEGHGLAIGFAHVVGAELKRGALHAVDLQRPPPAAMLYVATLSGERRSPVATALREFMATPLANQAVLTRSGAKQAMKFKPAVYVTLWR